MDRKQKKNFFATWSRGHAITGQLVLFWSIFLKSTASEWRIEEEMNEQLAVSLSGKVLRLLEKEEEKGEQLLAKQIAERIEIEIRLITGEWCIEKKSNNKVELEKKLRK